MVHTVALGNGQFKPREASAMMDALSRRARGERREVATPDTLMAFMRASRARMRRVV